MNTILKIFPGIVECEFDKDVESFFSESSMSICSNSALWEVLLEFLNFFKSFLNHLQYPLKETLRTLGDVFSREKKQMISWAVSQTIIHFFSKNWSFHDCSSSGQVIWYFGNPDENFPPKIEKRFDLKHRIIFSLKKACFFKNNVLTCRIHFWQTSQNFFWEKSKKVSN